MPPTLRGGAAGAKRNIDAVTTTRSPTLTTKAKVIQNSQSTSKSKGPNTTTSKPRPTNKTQKNGNAPESPSSSLVNSTTTTQEPHNAAKKPTLHISPVDQWNQSSSESSSSSAPSSPEDAANPRVFQGTIKDADGRPHYVLKVTQVFHAVDWRGCGRKSGPGAFELGDCSEEPVSPKSIPGVKREEFGLQSRGDGSVFYGAVDGEVDPETMSPFYSGILRMYGHP
ncbi:hypothetical protein KC332_g7559 [Hortaea werneckii]|nr:hypothetical protein KC358_g7231 [Hortaea werneckii]KAI6830774.1 hypothetical protein KC350_g7496 [Hortaea werneckii]KAI6929945.1 hypothetical protein KC348_g7707 [Hortaea werneckii]KAI6933938.1 hypothetical protein KC341_g7955 [Hortaea werneckii]KAI6962297.1 hypothetical protein KC321_g11835 [Hortaea werneckii]